MIMVEQGWIKLKNSFDVELTNNTTHRCAFFSGALWIFRALLDEGLIKNEGGHLAELVTEFDAYIKGMEGQ